jgi:hypothetical protein
MSSAYIAYDLQEGYIMNWLAAGPQAIPLDDQKDYSTAGAKLQVARDLYEKDSGIRTAPVERGPLHEGTFKIGDYEGSWNYLRCREDRLIDHSAVQASCCYLRSWAFTQLDSPADQEVEFVVSTFGPVDVWVNKKNVCHAEEISDRLSEIRFNAGIKSGNNQLLVRFGSVAAPECALAIAVRLSGEGISVRIPTLIPSIKRRNELEEIYEKIYLDREVYTGHEKITLRWPEGGEKAAAQAVRLQTASGSIYAQADEIGKPGAVHYLGIPVSIPEGPYKVLLMPRSWEFYEKNIRITREIDLWCMGLNRFSDQPYGTFEERRREALIQAARKEGDLFAEIAKVALQAYADLQSKVFENAVASIKKHQRGSEINLLGLLGMVSRYGSQAKFPASIREQVKECALGFPYWPETPGSCAKASNREGRQLILDTCAILAGQLYPGSVFTHSGLTGRQLRKKGEALALAWMQERATQGFTEWDTKATYADALAALSHLADLSKTESIWELASVLMDKMFFSIALNSYRGVFGSVQGCASAVTFKSGLLEETSGITHLMWGMGIYNHHLAGLVSLACMEKYELPPIINEIAASRLAEIWSREQHAASGQPVNKVTYRTPDYLLSSAQDYHPGEPGSRQHIWQATLGPGSIVFVNHPGCSSENDARAPGFWLGNAALPRVAQWKDTLVALYHLPQDAWLEFTHAYFPTAEFDEYAVQGNTAFARKGEGYLALTASQSLALITTGRSAYRELRSLGRQCVWVCRMGRSALDGSFAAFQEKVQAAGLSINGLNTECRTLRGDTLSFGWDTPFLVNGETQPLSGFSHYQNIFTTAELPCKEMEVKTDQYLLRLNFGAL